MASAAPDAALDAALILHHYDASPYSEKIRLLFGYKGLDWRSVAMPPMLPKPDLMALTGAYRRAPVLQIGADVYCDSALIVLEIERRFPGSSSASGSASTPALAGGAAGARAGLIAYLVDEDLFWRAVGYVMALRAGQIPQALLDDRAHMHPQMNFERGALAAQLPHLADRLRPLLALLDAALAEDDFLGGALPAGGDFNLYHPLWFLQNAGALATLAPQAPHLHAWMARMAAFGHGRPSPMTPQQAIECALRSEPAALAGASTDAGPGIAAGTEVEVMPAGYPQEAVRGRLLALDGERVVVAHASPLAGLIHLHFPRLGYVVQTAA